MVVVGALVGLPPAPSRALGGHSVPAAMAMGQVRIFGNGGFLGGGTLVDRNWVLTTEHLIDDLLNPGAYTIRVGVTNNHDDAIDAAGLRRIDRIAYNPQFGVVMLHFADPVPEGTQVLELTTAAPDRWDPLYLFGWGDSQNPGTTLRVEDTVAYDPVATENGNAMRTSIAGFSNSFPLGIAPLVVPVDTQRGDAGGGLISRDGRLFGIHTLTGSYYRTNETGNFRGDELTAGYEQPVWRYRQWVLDTINGAGPSNPPPDAGGPPRRRLGGERVGGRPPMTLPPQSGPCAAVTAPCAGRGPGWKLGVLLGAGNYRGTALVRCASSGSEACSFQGVAPAAGVSARLGLGPVSAPLSPGTRQVMVWCRTTTAFPDAGSPARPVLRVSFTNADPADTPAGYGWWDVTPDQVGTGTGQTPLDPGPLQPC
ncbi:MAG TPA: trypsin-like serine protease [Kineosporiaceae bacterium]